LNLEEFAERKQTLCESSIQRLPIWSLNTFHASTVYAVILFPSVRSFVRPSVRSAIMQSKRLFSPQARIKGGGSL